MKEYLYLESWTIEIWNPILETEDSDKVVYFSKMVLKEHSYLDCEI